MTPKDKKLYNKIETAEAMMIKGAKKAVKKIASMPKKFIDTAIERDKDVQYHKKDISTRMIIDNFGSVQNYEKFQAEEAKLKAKKKTK